MKEVSRGDARYAADDGPTRSEANGARSRSVPDLDGVAGGTGAGLPLAVLVGATKRADTPSGCSVLFHLQLPDSTIVDLSYATLLTLLRFAQREGVVPTLDEDWWSRTGCSDGCALQDAER